MELKSFVDFAYSMVNMDEVKSGKFLMPTSIEFKLGGDKHVAIHKEVLAQTESNLQIGYLDFSKNFEVDILGINFKFIND